jgi:hypothetical protein
MEHFRIKAQQLMTREGQESRRTVAVLGHRVAEGADAGQIADALCATWQAIEVALAPIIGSRGVAALYRRSLYLTGASHPWLAGLQEDAQGSLDLAALKPVFSRQSRADAIAGGDALLQNLDQLLASLIGASLAERLLRSVWAGPGSTLSSQDTTP